MLCERRGEQRAHPDSVLKSSPCLPSHLADPQCLPHCLLCIAVSLFLHEGAPGWSAAFRPGGSASEVAEQSTLPRHFMNIYLPTSTTSPPRTFTYQHTPRRYSHVTTTRHRPTRDGLTTYHHGPRSRLSFPASRGVLPFLGGIGCRVDGGPRPCTCMCALFLRGRVDWGPRPPPSA